MFISSIISPVIGLGVQVTIPSSGTIATFVDNFSSYPSDKPFEDGESFGPWFVAYNGYGTVMVERDSQNSWLHESPKASTSFEETHASMVVGPSFSGPLTYEADILTVEQLRTGSPPKEWEVAWLVWHYTDDDRFYYFIPKPNGWELGKEDPAYAGSQRFLATGTSPLFPINSTYHVTIKQDSNNKITVFVDGSLIVEFTDTERPYTSGKIGFYNEDAHVHFDNINVIQ
jgi:hypothetical protein